MTEEEIFNKIAELIADNFQLDKDKITMDTNFTKDLDEDEFGAEIPDEDAENIATVGDAVKYIKAHQG